MFNTNGVSEISANTIFNVTDTRTDYVHKMRIVFVHVTLKIVFAEICLVFSVIDSVL